MSNKVLCQFKGFHILAQRVCVFFKKQEGIRDDIEEEEKRDNRKSRGNAKEGRLNDHKHWPIIPNHLPSTSIKKEFFCSYSFQPFKKVSKREERRRKGRREVGWLVVKSKGERVEKGRRKEL